MSRLISFPTAKLAKEKGFSTDNLVLRYYCEESEKIEYNPVPCPLDESCEYYASTQTELADWLFEKHIVWVQATPMFTSNEMIGVSVTASSWKFPVVTVDYDGYDVWEGFERGLVEALGMI